MLLEFKHTVTNYVFKSLNNSHTMKSILSLFLVFLFSQALFAQVNFENISMKEALAKAQKEHKKVFIDVYASWCGPCKIMDREVFSQKEVGERMAKEYIALKIDREKDPRRKSLTNYYIKGYPTMLILDSTGMEIGRIYGRKSVEVFMQELDKYIDVQLSPINQAFQNIEANPNNQKVWKESLAFLYDKYNTMSKYQLFDKYLELCNKYYQNFTITQIIDKDDLYIFRRVKLPLEHPVVQFYLTDSAEYGSYLHKDYMTLSFKQEVKNSKRDTAVLSDIRKRASDYHAYVQKIYNGDVESKEYFLNEIFKELPPASEPKESVKPQESEKKEKKKKRRKRSKKTKA
jgi:thioredoxin-related protein